MSTTTTSPSSSGLAAVALAVAAVGVVVSGMAFGEVRALRADVEALRATPAVSGPAEPAPRPTPTRSTSPSTSPLDLSPWSALPASPAVRIPRAALDNTDEIVKSVRVVPAFEQGVTVGFKFFSVREGTLFAQIGVQNGDVLVAVNGLPVTTPDQALAAHEQLRTAPLVTLSIRRRGEPVRLDVVFE